MARKSGRTTSAQTKGRGEQAPAVLKSVPASTGVEARPDPAMGGARSRLWTIVAVVGLLGLHVALAERSLLQENPTVDEVVHLPAGVTYLQKRTFRLYHHNPPLIKMIAALPVVWAGPVMEPVYQQPSWTAQDPSPTTFSQTFAFMNAARYFELFSMARMVMPLFSVVGGLAVFAWSRRLYGTGGGLLSLALWVFCPNILAHSRLITTDVGSTAVGVAATYTFWLYLRQPSWTRAGFAGVMLGLAQLTKFSMLLLYGVWPFLWLVHALLTTRRSALGRQLARGLGHGLLVVVLSVFTIDAGYLFEGVGIPLGRFEFGSATLTRPVEGGFRIPPRTKNQLYAMLWPFRENRFRGTFLAGLPMPLPEHYLLGFDEQKVEADALPNRLLRAGDVLNRSLLTGNPLDDQAVAAIRKEIASPDDSVSGYPVYLNGEIRNSGWWYYYLYCLLYKVPEGTWLIVVWAGALLLIVPRSPESWADEIGLATVPLIVLFTMSFLTNINLGLRYVLAIAPYVFVSAGKIVPWVEGLREPARRVGRLLLGLCLGLTVVAALSIHPHYLAYFNWASGGPDREIPRLIDSNLDWGQDLLGLREWCRNNLGDQPIGLAYFGQVNPSMFCLRGDRLDWFLPPAFPGRIQALARDPGRPPPRVIGPARRLTPGFYAVSATLANGLHWRLYDNSPIFPDAWAPAWNAFENDAYGYFRMFRPIARIGHSIYVYKLSQEDVDRATPLLQSKSG